jgi:Aldehyde dehydrogenase family
MSQPSRRTLPFVLWNSAGGFRLVTGGHKLSGPGYNDGYYVEPMIFDGVDNASRLGQEEIFGPVVAVTTFRDEAEAIELGERGGLRPGRRRVERRLPARHACRPAYSRGHGLDLGQLRPARGRDLGRITSRAAWGVSSATTG